MAYFWSPTGTREQRNPRAHHMWQPAVEAAKNAGLEDGAAGAAAKFADWYVTWHPWDNLHQALADYLKTNES